MHEFLLTPMLLLEAYAAGIFPMAEDARSDEVYWLDPEERGILPLEHFHVPKRLRRTLRQERASGGFEIRVDSAFQAVMKGCAEATPDRPETWINAEILELYTALAGMGCAHSVETWQDGHLVGGLYGVRLGAAFFGESMFSRVTDASKVALVHLAARLWRGGFTLLDTQFITAHLARFGAITLPRTAYKARLRQALERPAEFYHGEDEGAVLEAFLQSMTQTS